MTLNQALALAGEWVDAERFGVRSERCRYEHILVRKNQDGNCVIQFVYEFVEDRMDRPPLRLVEMEKKYTQWLFSMTDRMKRRFGNDLVGWDISPSFWEVTG